MSHDYVASPMPKLTFITGAILVVVGLGGYLFSLTNETDHWTALIPALVGLLLVVSGAIALKNLMAGVHIALVLALIGALGMIMPLMSLGTCSLERLNGPQRWCQR